MSSSMPIPQRKLAGVVESSSPASSSFGSSPSTPPMLVSSSSKGKQRAVDISPPSSPSASSPRDHLSARRPSLLGSSLSKSEYTVVNLARDDAPVRLVTCVKSSQGFDWNQELFLPSYIDYESNDLERRPDPVEEIILTDEEAAAILPQ